jgi:hypothetical protein
MLIESSHRLDTGAPDEEVVAASACEGVGAAQVWKPLTLPTEDEGSTAQAAQAPPGCPSE